LSLAGLVLAPLVLYAYVPWAGSRGLPPGSWPVDTPAAFGEFLLDRGYTSQIRPDAALAGRLVEEARVLARSFGPLGVLLGIAGTRLVISTRPRSAVMLVLLFVPQAVLGASYLLQSNYQLPRHWVFYLPGIRHLGGLGRPRGPCSRAAQRTDVGRSPGSVRPPTGHRAGRDWRRSA
jgi:hypothetical protein